MSFSTRAYGGSWKTGAPASWQYEEFWKRPKTVDPAGANHSWQQSSSWQRNAPCWSVGSVEKHNYVSSSRSGGGWHDCGSTTVHLVPKPKIAKLKRPARHQCPVKLLRISASTMQMPSASIRVARTSVRNPGWSRFIKTGQPRLVIVPQPKAHLLTLRVRLPEETRALSLKKSWRRS